MEVCGEHQQDFMDDQFCPYCELRRLENALNGAVKQLERANAAVGGLKGCIRKHYQANWHPFNTPREVDAELWKVIGLDLERDQAKESKAES
jgi:hypothetical protein